MIKNKGLHFIVRTFVFYLSHIILFKKRRKLLMHTQEGFYKKLIEEQRVVTVFLINGVRVPGIIMATDKFSVLISNNGKQQFLYKQAISTIAV